MVRSILFLRIRRWCILGLVPYVAIYGSLRITRVFELHAGIDEGNIRVRNILKEPSELSRRGEILKWPFLPLISAEIGIQNLFPFGYERDARSHQWVNERLGRDYVKRRLGATLPPDATDFSGYISIPTSWDDAFEDQVRFRLPRKDWVEFRRQVRSKWHDDFDYQEHEIEGVWLIDHAYSGLMVTLRPPDSVDVQYHHWD